MKPSSPVESIVKVSSACLCARVAVSHQRAIKTHILVEGQSASKPSSSVWVVMAWLMGHYSENAGATGLSPVEAPGNFFWLFCNCLNCHSLRWSRVHFIMIHVADTHLWSNKGVLSKETTQ